MRIPGIFTGFQTPNNTFNIKTLVFVPNKHDVEANLQISRWRALNISFKLTGYIGVYYLNNNSYMGDVVQNISLSHEAMEIIRSKISPCKGDHSIKEAVISVFLTHPVDLQKFEHLSLPTFSTGKPKVELLKTINIPYNEEKTDLDFDKRPPSETMGIRFIAENNGVVSQLLQGLNETKRSYISYHNLNYDRWKPFFENYLSYITDISNALKGLKIAAFSLHYIDEFRWLGEENIDSGAIFNSNSEYIPKIFFNSISGNFVITTERVFDGRHTCFERIEINTEKIGKTITVSHNLTRVLSNVSELEKLIKSEEFSKILDWAHHQNKAFLKGILRSEVQDLIKLEKAI